MRRLLLAVLLASLAAMPAVPRVAAASTVEAERAPEAGRLIFSWNETTAGRVAQAGRTVRLLFDRPVEDDLIVPLAQLAGWLRDLRTTARPGEIIAELADDTSAVLQPLAPGTLVLELRYEKGGAGGRNAVEQSPTAVSTPARASPRPEPDGPRRVRPLAPAAGEVGADRVAPRSRPSREAGHEPSPARGNASRPVSEQAGRHPRPATADPAVSAPATAHPSLAVTTSRASRSLVPDLEPAAGPIAPPRSAPTGAGSGLLRVRAGKPVPAAAFARAGILWLVIGAARRELAAIGPSPAAPPGWTELPPVEGPDLVALRFRPDDLNALRVVRDGTGWTVERAAADAGSDEPPPIRDVEGTLLVEASGRLASLTDPATGDRLGILLSAQAGLRQADPLSYVDVEFLPTLLGLAWRAQADGIKAKLDEGHLAISRPGGLRTAEHDPWAGTLPGSPGVAVANGEALAAVATTPKALPIEPLHLAGLDRGEPLAARRRKLIDRLPALEPAAAQAARLELARLYLADGLAAEAAASLDVHARSDRQERPDDGARLLLRGASELLLGRTRRAIEILAARETGDPEHALWRAAAHAEAGEWEAAGRAAAAVGRLWAEYPPRLRFRLGLALARAQLQAGRVDAALAVTDQLRTQPLNVGERARLDLVRGSVLARDGRARKAAEAFAAAAKSDDPAIRVQARFLGVVEDARRQGGGAGVAGALRELARERLLWRGHPDETRMLDALAGLERDAGNPAAALATWKTALDRQPGDELAAVITAEMRATLIAALATAGEGGLDPITAYALYRDNEGLLPGEAAVEAAGRLSALLAAAGVPRLAADLTPDRAAPDDPAADGSAGDPTRDGPPGDSSKVLRGLADAATLDGKSAKAVVVELQREIAELREGLGVGGTAPVAAR